MTKPKFLALVLLCVVLASLLEMCIIARLVHGVFDPRCLVLRSYVVSHSYQHGREMIRCVRDVP